MSYDAKYLKYKKKYLNLKSKYGYLLNKKPSNSVNNTAALFSNLNLNQNKPLSSTVKIVDLIGGSDPTAVADGAVVANADSIDVHNVIVTATENVDNIDNIDNSEENKNTNYLPRGNQFNNQFNNSPVNQSGGYGEEDVTTTTIESTMNHRGGAGIRNLIVKKGSKGQLKFLEKKRKSEKPLNKKSNKKVNLRSKFFDNSDLSESTATSSQASSDTI